MTPRGSAKRDKLLAGPGMVGIAQALRGIWAWAMSSRFCQPKIIGNHSASTPGRPSATSTAKTFSDIGKNATDKGALAHRVFSFGLKQFQ